MEQVERAAQKQYWLEHSTTPTVEAMMLDSKAAEIDLLERPEVGGCLIVCPSAPARMGEGWRRGEGAGAGHAMQRVAPPRYAFSRRSGAPAAPR